MQITATMVSELRKATDAPFMECKKALAESNGDLDAAVRFLRESGIMKAAKKSDREQGEGSVGCYIHTNGKIGCMVELSCETDFAAKSDEFKAALRDICMHVTAADPAPLSVSTDGIPQDLIEDEKKIYEEQARQSGKPEEFWPKIVDGRITKFVKERTLLDQPFVKDPDNNVGSLITDLVAKLGENITIRRFIKFKVGE